MFLARASREASTAQDDVAAPCHTELWLDRPMSKLTLRAGFALACAAGCGDDPVEPDIDAPVATDPRIEVTPGNYVVGSDIVGEPLTGLSVSVRNSGRGKTGMIAASLSGSGDFKIGANLCSTLDTGDECTIGILFTPSTASEPASITGVLSLVADPGGAVMSNLSGIGLATNVLQASPTVVDFDRHPVGTTTAREMITVTNPGPAISGVLDVIVSAPFASHDDLCSGQTLAVGGTCTLGVSYSPTGTVVLGTDGDRAPISIHGNPGGNAMVRLHGWGYTLGITPFQHQFADTTVGQSSTDRVFTLTNTRAVTMGPLTVALTLGDITHFQLQTNTCASVTLQPQGTCTVGVRFTPLSVGDKLVALEVKAPNDGALRNDSVAAVVGKGI